MYEMIISLPENIRKALQLRIENFDPRSFEGIETIVFIGMGGSGIVGNVIRDLVDAVPIFLSKSYQPPSFINEKTLVICISYSGNTKETLSSYHEIQKKKCRILGVTSGGKLLELLTKDKKPHIKLPQGFLPRASLPIQLFALLNFFEKLGLYSMDREKILAFAESLKGEEQEAKRLAAQLNGKIPFIYTTHESAGTIFKIQLNETAKIHAKSEVFPELNHNEVVAWQSSPPDNICVVFLRDPQEREEIRASIELLKETIKNKTDIVEITPKGENKLEKLTSLTFLGSLTSYYLALLRGVDPAKTEYINMLKKIIKE